MSALPVWWRTLAIAAHRRAGACDRDAVCARLSGYAFRVWRHHRLALGTAWLICLLGWSGSLLLPLGAAPGGLSPTVRAAQANPAIPGEHASPRPVRPRPAQDHLAQAASLRADLDAAVALRAAHGRHLAEVPRYLDDRPNPIHQRRSVQLAQQDALVAALRRRLAALEARADERLPPDRAAGPEDGTAAAAAGGGRAPAGLFAVLGGVPRLAALGGVMLLASLAAAALALWRGQHDGIIDHPSQLPSAVLPVLCTIALPATPEREQREHASRQRAALACLGLLALFAGLAIADRVGVLASLRAGLPAGPAG